MEDKILALLDSLINFTSKAHVKWAEGTEEGEFYINISGRGILISYKECESQEYKISLLDSEGKSILTIQISPNDKEIYESARRLYNLASTSNDRSGQTIDEIISFINSNIDGNGYGK